MDALSLASQAGKRGGVRAGGKDLSQRAIPLHMKSQETKGQGVASGEMGGRWGKQT